MADRVFGFELDSHFGKFRGHLLNIAEAHTNRRPAKLDHISHFTDSNPIGDVVGFDLFGAASVDTSALMRNLRIAEGASYDSRPCQIFWHNRGSRTYVRLRIEPQPKY